MKVRISITSGEKPWKDPRVFVPVKPRGRSMGELVPCQADDPEAVGYLDARRFNDPEVRAEEDPTAGPPPKKVSKPKAEAPAEKPKPKKKPKKKAKSKTL